MDNAGPHIANTVKSDFLFHMTHLYTPPNYPDFNPIESAFSKLRLLVNKKSHTTEIDLIKSIYTFVCVTNNLSVKLKYVRIRNKNRNREQCKRRKSTQPNI